MPFYVYETHKPKTDPTYSPEWSGKTGAPMCLVGRCTDCDSPLHHEAGSHYCPGCDDYKPHPVRCKYDRP